MADEVTTPNAPETEPELSLDQHEAQFGTGAPTVQEQNTQEPTPEGQTTDDGSAPTPRDDKGRFLRGTRHRARSQQAGPADVPRIQELTRKLREAEEERDRLKAATPRESGESSRAVPVAERPAEPRPIAAPPPVAPRAKPTPSDTKPDGSPKYATYEDYLDDRDTWNRDEWRREQAARDQAAHVSASWRSRTDAAKSKHDDFEQVALMGPTRIPENSIIDAWILEDDDGAEILYHLQKHPTELDRLLSAPPFQQVKQLSLLGQRLTGDSSTRTQATSTGAVARPAVVIPPRPPTPVRTGPVRAADEPPDDEHASIAEHEKFYGPRARVR